MKINNISDLGNIDIGIISGSGLHGLSNILSDITKINYSDIEWEMLIKNQLDRGWPIVYRGYSEDAGHAWNMDCKKEA